MRQTVAVLVSLFLAATAAALINAELTPQRLEKDAALICTVRAGKWADRDRGVELSVIDVLKGKAPGKTLRLSFARVPDGKDGAAQLKDAVALLRRNGDAQALFLRTKETALLHVNGTWLRLSSGGADDLWAFERFDASLNGTFNGGTDMLIRTVRFLRRFPEATCMRIEAGVRWDDPVKLGKVAGKATAILFVDVNDDDKPDVFVACAKGDKVFLNRGEKFEEMPGLDSASTAAAWADLDGDGRVDLVSLTPAGLKFYLQTARGKFTGGKVHWSQKITGECLTLDILDVNADGRPDLVVGLGPTPFVLKNLGGGAFADGAVPVTEQKGLTGPCVVADFDGDGLTDIVSCGRDNGVLYRGNLDGTFAEAVACGAGTGKAKVRRASVADLDGDGLLDLVLAGGDCAPRVLHNRGKRFEDVTSFTGELGYVLQPGAGFVAASDFNNDGFPDLFAGYDEEAGQVFFNRGFRSFGFSKPMQLNDRALEGSAAGQSAAAWADLNGDGAEELVVALADGSVHLCRTDLAGKQAPLAVRVRIDQKVKYAGPVVVRLAREGVSLGTRVVSKWGAAAHFGVSEAGEYALTWKLPGQAEVTHQLKVSKVQEFTITADESGVSDSLRALKAVYATRPRDYPTAKGHAQPDTAAPFRWHGYRDDAVRRHEDAKMNAHTDPYNLLEDAGVAADPLVRFTFVAEHVTHGKKSLRVEFPAAAIKAGRAQVQVKCVDSPILNDYFKYRRSAYWADYRWLKADAYNPADQPVRLRICGVPLVLEPGANRIAVKTVDAVGWRGDYPGWFMSVPIEVIAPSGDVTLFLDHFRMEQEVPAVIASKGRMFQFPISGGVKDSALMLYPGFTAIEKDTLYTQKSGFGWTKAASKRTYGGLSFRSNENALIWCRCENADSPLRFDVPNGRWGVWLFAAPVQASVWTKGVSATVNGQAQPLFAARTPEELRRVVLAGEAWDYRPGSCLWTELVRDAYFPAAQLLSAEVKDGHVLLELPPGLALRAVVLFPEADRQEALREIGRLEYLLAESWDVAHAWVRGAFAEKDRYIGFHDEMARPEKIPGRLDDLKLTAADFQRGFVLFQRGLTDAVYPDTIPSRAETAAVKASGFAAPGESECLTISLLPLAERKGLRIEAGALVNQVAKIPAAALDIRLARYHHKCMEYGHHNHCYNFQEHHLVRRPRVDLYPGAARRIYIDVTVPSDTPAGTYRGELRLLDAGDKVLATVPLELEVLPLTLLTPPVYFGVDNGHTGVDIGTAPALLKRYGINFVAADYDVAVRHGFQGYAVWPYNAAPPRFEGRRIGWGNFEKEKDLLSKLIAAGKSGKGPRGFFGGLVHYQKPSEDKGFLTALLKTFPDMDILGVTTPVYAFHGADYVHSGEPWRSQIRSRGKANLLEEAAESGKEFWFVDWMRHSKEQPARFSFGFWLWRLGAKGRFSTFTYGGDYHYATAKVSYPVEPYYTLLGVVGGNATPAVKESIDGKDLIPSRDLLLIREGIDDYRYVYTLDRLVREAEAKKLDAPAVTAARKYLDKLRQDLSLDLATYYESRTASYAENWYPRADNPWTHGKFQDVRRQVAAHVLAVKKGR